MPPLEDMDMVHPAVYWELTGRNDYGEPQLATRRQIYVRWVWAEARPSGADSSGETPGAQVASTEWLSVGSLIWQGTEADWLADPAGDESVMEVSSTSSSDELRGEFTRYMSNLGWWKGASPE